MPSGVQRDAPLEALSGNRPGTKVLESNLRGQSTSSSRTHIRTLQERVHVVDQAETYLIVIMCSQYKGVSAREKVREVVHSPLNSSY